MPELNHNIPEKELASIKDVIGQINGADHYLHDKEFDQGVAQLAQELYQDLYAHQLTKSWIPYLMGWSQEVQDFLDKPEHQPFNSQLRLSEQHRRQELTAITRYLVSRWKSAHPDSSEKASWAKLARQMVEVSIGDGEMLERYFVYQDHLLGRDTEKRVQGQWSFSERALGWLQRGIEQLNPPDKETLLDDVIELFENRSGLDSTSYLRTGHQLPENVFLALGQMMRERSKDAELKVEMVRLMIDVDQVIAKCGLTLEEYLLLQGLDWNTNRPQLIDSLSDTRWLRRTTAALRRQQKRNTIPYSEFLALQAKERDLPSTVPTLAESMAHRDAVYQVICEIATQLYDRFQPPQLLPATGSASARSFETGGVSQDGTYINLSHCSPIAPDYEITGILAHETTHALHAFLLNQQDQTPSSPQVAEMIAKTGEQLFGSLSGMSYPDHPLFSALSLLGGRFLAVMGLAQIELRQRIQKQLSDNNGSITDSEILGFIDQIEQQMNEQYDLGSPPITEPNTSILNHIHPLVPEDGLKYLAATQNKLSLALLEKYGNDWPHNSAAQRAFILLLEASGAMNTEEEVLAWISSYDANRSPQ